MSLTLHDLAADLDSGAVTSAHLAERTFRTLDDRSALNMVAHRASTDSVMAQAALLDAELRCGHRRSPLHGVPMTVKDLFHVDGMPTRGGTRAALPDLGGEATAVARLKAAGAIIVAKTNLHEIAAGVSGENPWTGDVCNPHDPTRQAGGSSSGSAVSVAADVVPASLGSDTAGSIRVPAAFCGVVGFKPTFGFVPLDGALPLCWSCDHGGPLTNSVVDAHTLTEILTARTMPLQPASRSAPTRLALPRRFLDGWLGAGVRRRFDDLLASLRARHVELVEVDVPGMDEALDAYAPLRAAESALVHRAALTHDPLDFSPPVRERLIVGRDMPMASYLAAQRARAMLSHEMHKAFAGTDAMILPTAPLPAPLRGTGEVVLERGRTEHRAAFVRLTLPFSFTGVPALALPCGTFENMPISVQIAGPSGADARVLEIGRWLEQHLVEIA